VAQRPGAGAAHEQLRICMVGLCYDTPSVEAMPFVAIPDKTPSTVSYDFYQEKLPYKPPLAWIFHKS
jgi:hypothetical protein